MYNSLLRLEYLMKVMYVAHSHSIGPVSLYLNVCPHDMEFVCFRNVSLQREIEQMRELHEDTLQKLQEKHTADMSHFQQEHDKSVTKVLYLSSHRNMLYCITLFLFCFWENREQ